MRHLLIGLAAVATAGAASAAIPFYPTAGIENPAAYTFTAAATGDLVAYFAGSTAGYSEVLGVLVNGVDSGITGLENHSTPLGTALNFGQVNAGDSLTFYINVLTTGDTFYSKPSMNVDGVQHVWSTSYAGGDYGIPAGTFVAFEDLRGGGDLNYNDLDFVFTNVAAENTVPEPATWALMIAGFGLVGGALRRRNVVAA
jgi:hypothetical protein